MSSQSANDWPQLPDSYNNNDNGGDGNGVHHSDDPLTDYMWNNAFIRTAEAKAKPGLDKPENIHDVVMIHTEDQLSEHHKRELFFFMQTLVLQDDLHHVAKALETGVMLTEKCGDHNNLLSFAFCVCKRSEILTYLLNTPTALAAVRYESPDGQTIFASVTCVHMELIELLLFMGAPNCNSKGNFFWETSSRKCALTERERMRWQQLERNFLAIREVIYSIFKPLRFPPEVMLVLLPYFTGCVPAWT